MLQIEQFALVLYISALVGIAGSFWILQEKRFPQNVFAKLLYALAKVDIAIGISAAVFGFIAVNYKYLFGEPLFQYGLFVLFLYLAYLYYLIGFSIAFVPVYIILFKGTVGKLNKVPLVTLCFVGASTWTAIIVATNFTSANWVSTVGVIFLFGMFSSMCFCFMICWKELNADKTKRKNVQSMWSFEQKEYYLKQASTKMTRFTGNFALVQLLLILPFLSLIAISLINAVLFHGQSPILMTVSDVLLCVVTVSISGSGFFHCLAVHFSLFHKIQKKQRPVTTSQIPLRDFETTTFVENPVKPDMVHLFTGQKLPAKQYDTIDLIKG
ncbi:hypothetical protein HDV06_003084 [Boothiomyces sp. JEL0866]|nr:hypothetical protein HDV06_000528 [Boothiomyces sp. JEL0866]KAJ3322364.1 hypothetical protein HDV06_003084 [Boothiomyces sp. JEL0866]